MNKTRRIAIGGWFSGSLGVATRGWYGAEPGPPSASGGSGGGRPWPQKLVNLLFDKRAMIRDDEDFLLIIGD